MKSEKGWRWEINGEKSHSLTAFSSVDWWRRDLGKDWLNILDGVFCNIGTKCRHGEERKNQMDAKDR